MKEYLQGTMKEYLQGTMKEYLQGTMKEYLQGTMKEYLQGTMKEYLQGTMKEYLQGTLTRCSHKWQDRIRDWSTSFWLTIGGAKTLQASSAHHTCSNGDRTVNLCPAGGIPSRSIHLSNRIPLNGWTISPPRAIAVEWLANGSPRSREHTPAPFPGSNAPSWCYDTRRYSSIGRARLVNFSQSSALTTGQRTAAG
ncbi:hypothetical protein BKA70DRAFT_1452176 [Coprinopsis sp. MPI-PUGE-AT-0042]|nr:hypothetical protein BKA70DRAFT_1452176 [Coprinopsis sp. MPI-PUGE-AT-0042]